jgi:hypothetical protein
MSYPSHPLQLDYSNYTSLRVQVVKLPIMQFSAAFRTNIRLNELYMTLQSLSIFAH